MRKVLMGVAGVAVLGGAALVGLVASQPEVTHVERSVTIPAPAADVWPHVHDLRKFVVWSPWSGLDPNQVVTFSDPPTGVGSWYTWAGNADVGSGKMSVTALAARERVDWDLEFVEPIQSTADVYITLAADGDGTRVTWGMDSHNGFMGKAFGLVMDMDAMLGADFEKGLGNLSKVAVESAAKRKEGWARAQAEVQAELDALLRTSAPPTP